MESFKLITFILWDTCNAVKAHHLLFLWIVLTSNACHRFFNWDWIFLNIRILNLWIIRSTIFIFNIRAWRGTRLSISLNWSPSWVIWGPIVFVTIIPFIFASIYWTMKANLSILNSTCAIVHSELIPCRLAILIRVSLFYFSNRGQRRAWILVILSRSFNFCSCFACFRRQIVTVRGFRNLLVDIIDKNLRLFNRFNWILFANKESFFVYLLSLRNCLLVCSFVVFMLLGKNSAHHNGRTEWDKSLHNYYNKIY